VISETLMIIAEQVLLYLPLVLGAYINIAMMKVPDLSIETAYVFGSIFGARMLFFTSNLPSLVSLKLVLFAAVVGGACVGLLSSALTKIARLPHLLSCILTIGIFHGLNQLVLGTASLSISHLNNPLITQSVFPRNPEIFTLAVLGFVLLALGYLLLRTQLGFAFAVYGNNPRFFDHYHISQKYVFMVGIMLSNALAGISGYLVAQTSGFTDINAGFGMALFCITSLILGKTCVRSKRLFSISIPLIGIIVYCLLQQLLLKVGFNLKYFTMVQSIIVMCVLIRQFRTVSSTESIVDNLGV
jgi:putative ABC transport system permease protein